MFAYCMQSVNLHLDVDLNQLNIERCLQDVSFGYGLGYYTSGIHNFNMGIPDLSPSSVLWILEMET